MHVNRQLARVFEEHTVRSLAEAAQLAAIVRAQYQRQGKAFDLAQMRGGRAIMSDAQVIAEDGSAVALEERSAQVALRTGKLHSNQVMGYPRPDGSYLWLSSTSQPLYTGAGAAPTGVFTTVTDVTARKQAEAARDALEAQLRESQKMEAMGTLAGGIAHDFNNMLGAILGNVALARTEKDAGHPAAVSLDEIGRAGARARRLVQQILAFSRKQPQMFAAIALHGVVDETLGLLRASLPAGVRIDTSVDPVPRYVQADATQIGQVLMNLCTNAWHAMQNAAVHSKANADGAASVAAPASAPVISVRLDQIELDAAGASRFGAARGAWVRLTVSDTGIGMDAATQARMYEPFFTTRGIGEGTGLGLSVANGIVKVHGGAIAVTSAPGQGSVFEVILPAIAATPATAAGAAAAAASAAAGTATAPASVTAQETGAASAARSGQHVLYLDDEPAMVFLVTRMLTKLGYRVSAFERALDALAAVRADPASFDVVVTDFNMPGHSGLDVAREIGVIRPGLPVVIVSGYITDELRAGAEKLGVRELIYKPDTVGALCQSIVRVLQQL